MAGKQPLVSVIIPAYNAEVFLREAIDSALGQTYPNVEVIVIDDGSTDNTKNVAAPYVHAKKIAYHYQSNGGLSAARNAGIRRAQGEYIALLDADDIFLPEKLERQVDHLLANPDCDISYCDLYHFWDGSPDELLKLDYHYYSGDEVLPHLLGKGFVAPLAMVIRKSVFERFGLFDVNFRRSEDFEFLVRVTSRGGRVCFLGDILAKLRLRREGNLQSFKSQPEIKRTALAILERLYDESTPAERVRLGLHGHLSVARLKAAFAYLENGDKEEAVRFIHEAWSEGILRKLLAACASAFIRLVPASWLAWGSRKYHLYSQTSSLRKTGKRIA